MRGRLLKNLSTKSLGKIFLELFLIFIGVLSALGVENYRESVADRKKEIEYLVAFKGALQSDTATINLELVKCYQKLKAASRLLELIENPSQRTEDIEDLVSSIIMLIDPLFNTAIYEDIKSSGNLRLITNVELRNIIIQHYVAVNNLMERQKSAIGETSYNVLFTDHLDFNEFTFEKEMDAYDIINRLKKSDTAIQYLRRLEQKSVTLRNSLLFNALPNALNLLEKVDLEIRNLN